MRKIVGLAVGDDFEEFLEGFLPAFERLQEKAGGADSFLEVGTGLLVGRTVPEKIFVHVADAEAWQEISFQQGKPTISV